MQEPLITTGVNQETDTEKRYDLHLGSAKKVVITTTEGRAVEVVLSSETLSAQENDFKVKIENANANVDVHVKRRSGISETEALEGLEVQVKIPSAFLRRVELNAKAGSIEIDGVECDDIELDVKTGNIVLSNVAGSVEIDCNQDLNITCCPLKGEVAINQINAVSKIYIPEGSDFMTVKKGIGNSIAFEKSGKAVEAFDQAESENIIELNGFRSSLTICEN